MLTVDLCVWIDGIKGGAYGVGGASSAAGGPSNTNKRGSKYGGDKADMNFIN